MLFNSPVFLFLFLPATVAAYIAVRHWLGPRAVLALLLVASIFFYGWWNPLYVPLLLGLALFNFLVARGITAYRAMGRSDWVSILLTFGVVVDLAVLGYFKYTDFFIETANTLFKTDFMLQHILLPLGISFFTFQKIAYLVDASRGEVQQHDLLEYCFFVMFFPQLLAGPITHHSEIFSQVKGPWAFAIKPSNFMLGLTIFVIGLFKKVVLADHFGPLVSPAYEAAAAGQPLDFFLAWQGAIAFKFQLYFDFSGYSEMALGAARLFGVQLPLNFNSPYRALNVVDFWRRWHMTLTRFLLRYVYIPLGGSRRGVPRLYRNLLITLALSGLWHGAAWHFALWGTVQGTTMIANHAWRSFWRPINAWWSHTTARLVTFFALTMVLVLHRAPSVDVALQIYRGMFNLPETWGAALGPMAEALKWLGMRFDGPPVEAGHLELVAWLIAWMAFMWFLPNTQQLLARWHPAYNYGVVERERDPPLIERIPATRWLPAVNWPLEWRPNLAGAVFVGVLAALAILSLRHVSEFLYFKY
ncbi:MAG: MBOAT family protein [Alphaproteobacteria bacterium]|nr:MAG: MBOAT family protein [Alphaproteobacteria bacterium]